MPSKEEVKKLTGVKKLTRGWTLSRKMQKEREGEKIMELTGHTEGINCMSISPDDSILASGSEDNTARIWNITDDVPEEERCLGELKGHKGYITCIFVNDRYVFTGSSDSLLKKWDLASCRCMFTFKGHTARIHKLLVTDELIFTTSLDKTARVWHMKITQNNRDKPCIRTLKGHTQGVYPLIFLPDCLEQSKLDQVVEDNNEVLHTGDVVITGGADTNAKIWSLYSGECLHTLKAHVGAITCMATDTRGKTLFTGGADNFIRFWDISSGKMLRQIEAHRNAILCMTLNHRLMYTGSADCMAKCWVPEFGDNTVVYKGHSLSVSIVKFYKGLVITGSGDGIIRCFDAKSGHLLRTFSGHDGAITSVQTSGEKIYSTTIDNTIRVFNINWEFVKDYLRVLSGDIDSQLGVDPNEEVIEEPIEETPPGPVNEGDIELEVFEQDEEEGKANLNPQAEGVEGEELKNDTEDKEEENNEKSKEDDDDDDDEDDDDDDDEEEEEEEE